MVHCFPHPNGIVYFRSFWDQLPESDGGGDGPWKVGEAVITLLGCQGTHPEQAAEYADWQFHLEQVGRQISDRHQLESHAREMGLLP